MIPRTCARSSMIALRDVLRFVQNCAMHVGSQNEMEEKTVCNFGNVLTGLFSFALSEAM